MPNMHVLHIIVLQTAKFSCSIKHVSKAANHSCSAKTRIELLRSIAALPTISLNSLCTLGRGFENLEKLLCCQRSTSRSLINGII